MDEEFPELRKYMNPQIEAHINFISRKKKNSVRQNKENPI